MERLAADDVRVHCLALWGGVDLTSAKALGWPSALSRDRQKIFKVRRADGASLEMLAKEFGVSRAAIQRVERRSCIAQALEKAL